jgi:uncharacterized membrane protein YkoI
MKRNIVIATVTTAALIGGGTVAAYASGNDDSAPTQHQASARVADDRDDAPEVRSEARTADVTAADAIAAALKHTPGTAVTADLDNDGRSAWEVDVVKGGGIEYTVQVSPSTGKLLGVHRDDDGDNDGRDDLAALKGTSVDAREAARAGAAKGTVTEVDLDDDHRPAVWSVETTKGEWTVDAHTGKVTQAHDEDDHDVDDGADGTDGDDD